MGIERTKEERAAFAERERVRMERMAHRVAEELGLDEDAVQVVTDVNEIAEPKLRKAKGWFDPKTGKITVVIPNHTGTGDVLRTMLHEAVAHKGLRGLFGKRFDVFLDNVYAAADETVRRRISTLASKHAWDFRRATEEYLAGMADAVKLCFDARRDGARYGDIVSTYARQGVLFADPDQLQTVADFNNATMLMLADVLNDKRVTLLKTTLQLYNNHARQSASGQADLFTGGIRSREDILREVINYINDNYGKRKEIEAARAEAVERRKAESVQQDGDVAAGSSDGEATAEPGAEPAPVEAEPVEANEPVEADPNAVQTALAAAEKETNTEPTEAQKEAGNYKKGHVKIDGYDVTIENPKGSVRRGTDASGKQWEQEMHNTYGYIRGTEGVDGDHIDVFFSDDPSQGDVFVVDQVNKDGSFDEHKVMYGFASEEEARKAYLSNYEDGWTGLGTITPVSKEEFKKWVQSSRRKTKPFAEYKRVKTSEGQNASAYKASRRKLADFNVGDVVRDYYNQKLYRIKKHSKSGVSTIAELDAEGNEVGTTTMNTHNNSRYSLAEAPVKAETPTISQDSEQVSDQDNAPYTIAPAHKRQHWNSESPLDAMEARLAELKRMAAPEQVYKEFPELAAYMEERDRVFKKYGGEDKVPQDIVKAVLDKYKDVLDRYMNVSDERREECFELEDLIKERKKQQADTTEEKSQEGQADSAMLYHKEADGAADAVTSEESALRDALMGKLQAAGIEVVTDAEEAQRVLDEVNGDARMQAKKRALETVSAASDRQHHQTVVSSADGAKVLNNLDKLVSDYEENEKTHEKTFIGTVANALGAQRKGSKSEYATFETKNGRVVTIRLADHNATVSNFDRRGELDGISIVVSPKKSAGVTNDGEAHVVEYYYDAIKLRRADGKSLAAIVRSIKQALYSGEFKDTTGLAERQEVNARELRQSVGVKMQKKPMTAEEQKHKETQLSIIHDTNPAPDDYHTWVRSIDDILTLQEAMDAVLAEDPEYELSAYPDVSDDMIREALRTGRITIYSSKPIKNGVFVTPSMMQAMDYSGGTKVFSKEVPIGNVAWINTDEGQYAATSAEATSQDKEVRFFRTPDGHAYGFTVGGKIYIDPRIAKADTPIHEYTHLWAAAVRQGDAKAWADIVRLMQGTPLWDEVAQHYPELAADVDALAEEVLSHYSGRRGAERLREAQRAAMEQDGLDAQAAAVAAVERVRQALKRFWRKVADFFGRRFTTAEEVADTVLADMLNGVKPAFAVHDGGVRYEANSEEAGIVARAKADGTYMKAPNGQPSKLTPRQWVQVRTKAFKEWFGDWEKAARVEMIQGLSAIGINPHSLSKDELHDLYRTFKPVQKDGHSIAFYNGAFKKIYKEGGLFAKIVPQLRDVFEQSLFAYEEADSLGGTVRKDGTVHKEHKNIVHYQNYVGKVDILGNTYYVRFTVQEEQRGLMGTHSFFVSNVDVYDNPTENRTIPITSRGTTDFDGIADAKLKKFFEEAKNSSRVVDENGEPRVVYHGSRSKRIRKFNSENGMTWVSSMKGYADAAFGNGGKTYSLYAKVHCPLYIGNVGIDLDVQRFCENTGLPYEDVSQITEELGAQKVYELTNSKKFRDVAVEQGYDGLEAIEAGGKAYAVFLPSQIKSATDNVGTFDGSNHDIRYQKSTDLFSEYGDRWLLEQTNDDGRHTTQVTTTIQSYKKFSEFVKRDSRGAEVDVLDASSGLGHGTEWMRSNGMRVDDVEPYPSSNRKKPTYSSYDDVKKKYDYIISNAVLNVIPEDWRSDLLHNMADKLKPGGKLVINVRGAESIKKQGVEGVTRITLDNPSEILVLRPNGSIKAYQKGFTVDELKSWCERELGEGYSVQRANKQNAGGSYDTAVVVVRNQESAENTNDAQTLDEVNARFNEDLGRLTEENKDRVVLSLGRPSGVLLAAGVEDKPMKLYGNKVIKKMKKHGFALDEIRDLPKAVAEPIAVFNNIGRRGNRSILTELRTEQGNFLVTVDLGKGAEDIDFNIISSVFGKGDHNVTEWFNNGLATYIDKEKALNYLHHSAPIAEALSNPKLVSAAKVVETFENPPIPDAKNSETDAEVLLREGEGVVSDAVLSEENDALGKMGIERTEEERAAFAERERARMERMAHRVAEELGLDEDAVQVVTDVNEITEPKLRKAKGWFDPKTG
ncbi:MAG: methyltransferase domain-containing protein, partial [Prevotellamassilia sp.]|nr:methyltransferase domain-containing protein [Prevotellamassilia sp.]